jgi:hypothetical protein
MTGEQRGAYGIPQEIPDLETRGGESPADWKIPADWDLNFTPPGYQGPARHTWTSACDGFHESQQCPGRDG